MLVVVSPAKNLDFDTPSIAPYTTQAEMLDKSAKLVKICKKLAPADLAGLMKISDKLAGLNADRFDSWSLPFDQSNAKAAVLAFNGDVYTGLDAGSFTSEDFDFAQQHLRILSGLYGVLKPLDLIQPYRLEMGTKLANPAGKDLYSFWQNQITQSLNQTLSQQGDELLINLASNEYFKSVNSAKLKGQIITPVFKDYKNGQYKIISFFAKKARGMMARYLIKNRLQDSAAITGFDLDGYRYSAEHSSQDKPTFIRDEMAKA